MLEPLGIDPDGFIMRIRPVKRFRLAWWGRDLIEAIEKAPALGEKQEVAIPAARNRSNRRGKGKGNEPGAKIDAVICELKGKAANAPHGPNKCLQRGPGGL